MRLGQGLQEPDVGDGRGQLDMAHPLAPNAGQGDLHAALLADDALVLHALVLAAQALVVLGRPEDAGAEQPVPLRLEGPVVDGLRLLDLAERPGADLLRRGQGDADLVEGRAATTGLKILRTSWFIVLPVRLRTRCGAGLVLRQAQDEAYGWDRSCCDVRAAPLVQRRRVWNLILSSSKDEVPHPPLVSCSPAPRSGPASASP